MGNLERWTLLGLDKPQAAQLAGMQPASSLKPVDSPSMPKPSCSSGSSGCTTTTTTQTSWCPPCLACTRPVHKSRARKLRAPPASPHHLCLSTKEADAQVVNRCKCTALCTVHCTGASASSASQRCRETQGRACSRALLTARAGLPSVRGHRAVATTQVASALVSARLGLRANWRQRHPACGQGTPS